MEIRLVRLFEDEDRTLGTLIIDRQNVLATLELRYDSNKKNVSCIPEGTYECQKRTSTKYGEHILVKNVPDREMILIHAGNYPSSTQGCILVGTYLSDIDKDGKLEVCNSKIALKQLVSSVPNYFTLKIGKL